MKRGKEETALQARIRSGEVNRQDVARRLAELAFGKANDCVRLALEEDPDLKKLDLSLLSWIRRSDKGAVEIKLVDRLQALDLLAQVAQQGDSEAEEFLRALQGETE